MTLPTDRIGDVTVVEVVRDLTLGSREELKETVGARLEAGDRKFVLDFAHTRFIDSSGLGALLSLSRRIRQTGGELYLAGLNEEVRVLFELTRLDRLFQITGSRAAALGEL